jgi:hypothetical protein
MSILWYFYVQNVSILCLHIYHVKSIQVHIMLKNVKIFPIRTKYKRNFFIGMKTSDFILQWRKLKFAIKVETENILYPHNNHFKSYKLFFKKKYWLTNNKLIKIIRILYLLKKKTLYYKIYCLWYTKIV